MNRKKKNEPPASTYCGGAGPAVSEFESRLCFSSGYTRRSLLFVAGENVCCCVGGKDSRSSLSFSIDDLRVSSPGWPSSDEARFGLSASCCSVGAAVSTLFPPSGSTTSSSESSRKRDDIICDVCGGTGGGFIAARSMRASGGVDGRCTWLRGCELARGTPATGISRVRDLVRGCLRFNVLGGELVARGVPGWEADFAIGIPPMLLYASWFSNNGKPPDGGRTGDIGSRCMEDDAGGRMI